MDDEFSCENGARCSDEHGKSGEHRRVRRRPLKGKRCSEEERKEVQRARLAKRRAEVRAVPVEQRLWERGRRCIEDCLEWANQSLRCKACWLPQRTCVCASMQRTSVKSHTEIVVWLHFSELFSGTNSGRVICQTLPEDAEM